MTEVSERPIYFSGLNGLRAICATAVVLSHTILNLRAFGLDPKIFGTFKEGNAKGLDLAGFGVSIFFVLSGFLITYLLQQERELQAINVKGFYARRILRIWPLYYLYLVICILVNIIFKVTVPWESLPYYLFFAANIPFVFGTTIPMVGHYWSLGVEEQFYLFWPWLNKMKSILPVSIVVLLLFFSAKLVVHRMMPGSRVDSFFTVIRFQCMMIGAIGALLYKRNNKLFMKFADNKITQIICWLVILCVAINRFHIASVFDHEIISVVGLMLIIGQIGIKNRVVNLENGLFNFLGKISYGMYVIHLLVIFLLSKLIGTLYLPPVYKYIVVFASIFGAPILLAHLSYKYYERYFLKIKTRFEVVKSTNSAASNK